MSEPTISILKGLNGARQPAVIVVLSKNAVTETADTHEVFPGIALTPEIARVVIARIQIRLERNRNHGNRPNQLSGP
jgi:hypothetical protein